MRNGCFLGCSSVWGSQEVSEGFQRSSLGQGFVGKGATAQARGASRGDLLRIFALGHWQAVDWWGQQLCCFGTSTGCSG